MKFVWFREPSAQIAVPRKLRGAGFFSTLSFSNSISLDIRSYIFFDKRRKVRPEQKMLCCAWSRGSVQRVESGRFVWDSGSPRVRMWRQLRPQTGPCSGDDPVSEQPCGPSAGANEWKRATRRHEKDLHTVSCV